MKVKYQSETSPFQFCWRNTVEECNHLTPINLHKNAQALESTSYYLTKLVLNPDHRLFLNMHNINDKTPLADDVELYILEMDGNLTPHSISKLNKYNYVFNLPKEKESYIFMIKAIFETHIEGIAYYPINVNVR